MLKWKSKTLPIFFENIDVSKLSNYTFSAKLKLVQFSDSNGRASHGSAL